MGGCAKMYELFRKREVDTNVRNKDVAKQFSENLEGTPGLDKPRQCVWR